MLSQQKADGELIKTYASVVAIILLLVLLAYLGTAYFGSIKRVGSQNIQVEHARLLNVLGVLRSKWLSSGKPELIGLQWQTPETDGQETSGVLAMSAGGWPLPDEASVKGCRQLLTQLLGPDYERQIVTRFNPESGVCRYIGESGGSISYQTGSGRVIFLTGEQSMDNFSGF